MLVSTNWLKDFVSLPTSLDSEALGLSLTMHSVEIEEVTSFSDMLEHVVLGVVASIEKHPDADKLLVCEVDAGSELVPIVCGGNNLREGMKVALAKVGARVLWHGEGELVELKRTKIRGAESAGMICTSDEIGLLELFPKQSPNEVMDLEHVDAKPGTPLAEVLHLDDTVIDIDNKSMTHRPDLWGHYGMAREIAAIQKQECSEYEPAHIKEGKEVELKASVEDTKLCPRYMAVVVDGITVAPSPQWMQSRLHAAGMRPINNIVDITNYVMLELGQPTHAFDARLVDDYHMVVRKASEDTFTTLDGEERSLHDQMLMIADQSKALAVAGVMGGQDSEVKEDTTRIIFESANFDATSVRKTSQALGLRTDGSARWEKSLDPHNAELGLRRLVELTLELCPGAKVVSNVVDVSNFELSYGPIEVSLDFITQRIGAEIDVNTVTDILDRLGFCVEVDKQTLHVTVPSWRATKDVSIPEDIVEEVARMYGYGDIEPTLPHMSIAPPQENRLRDTLMKMKQTAAFELGFHEVHNYSFVSPELLQKLDMTPEKHIELQNPVAKDRPYVRRSLMPNLLERVEQNLHRNELVALCETGQTFIEEMSGEPLKHGSDELLPKQDTYFGAVYAVKNEETPFFAVSNLARTMLDRLHLSYTIVEGDVKGEHAHFVHPGRYAEIVMQDTVVGRIGELHPKLANQMGIEERVGMLEINVNDVVALGIEKQHYTPLSVYPSVMRDIAFTVPAHATHAEIQQIFLSCDPLLVSVELFDVYQGKGVEDGKKSMAYHLEYRSDEKTLEAAEVDAIHARVSEALQKSVGAELRM